MSTIWSSSVHGGQYDPSCYGPGMTWEDVSKVARFGEGGDPTSINVDLSRTSTPGKCFKFAAEACPFDMKDVGRISFDVSMSKCKSVWAAPLWMSPTPWIGPQHKSGEIDFVENCHGSNNISFGESGQYFTRWPYTADDLPKRTVVIDVDHSSGTVYSKMCPPGEPDSSSCVAGKTREGYMQDTESHWGGRGRNFYLISDIWNGTSGPGSWETCNFGRADHASKCSYTVSNIKFAPRPGGPSEVFDQPQCKALNAGSVPPPPPSCCAKEGQDQYSPLVCKGSQKPTPCCQGLKSKLEQGKYICVPEEACCTQKGQDQYSPLVCKGSHKPTPCCEGLAPRLENGKYICA